VNKTRQARSFAHAASGLLDKNETLEPLNLSEGVAIDILTILDVSN
jgi:hypothetical protein